MLTPLDELVPELEGRPRREVLEERGAAFEPSGGVWNGRQHEPESATTHAGGDAGKVHLRESGGCVGGCGGCSEG